MPNGRSGGCTLRKTKLRQKLTGQPATVVIGYVLGSGSDSKMASIEVTAVDVLRLVDQFPGSRVWIEEHDHQWYIVHLDAEVTAETRPDASKWVVVKPDSPFFAGLKRMYRSDVLARVRALFSARSGGTAH